MCLELVEDTVALDLVPHLVPLLALLREHVASNHSIVLIRLQLGNTTQQDTQTVVNQDTMRLHSGQPEA